EAVSAQIHGHVRVAEGPQPAVDRVGDIGLERARDLVAPELDPGNRVVMADAEHAEAEIAQDALGRLDGPELLLRDLRVIGNARRQARRRGLVPRLEPGAAGRAP